METLRWERTRFEKRGTKTKRIKTVFKPVGGFFTSANSMFEEFRAKGYTVEWDVDDGCYRVSKDGVVGEEWRPIKIEYEGH